MSITLINKPDLEYFYDKNSQNNFNEIHSNISLHLDQEYKHLFAEIKTEIQTARLQAALAVNQRIIQLYWFSGKKIIEKQSETKWGHKLLQTLSNDLQQTVPETYGFSVVNLKRMRMLAENYPKLAS